MGRQPVATLIKCIKCPNEAHSRPSGAVTTCVREAVVVRTRWSIDTTDAMVCGLARIGGTEQARRPVAQVPRVSRTGDAGPAGSRKVEAFLRNRDRVDLLRYAVRRNLQCCRLASTVLAELVETHGP